MEANNKMYQLIFCVVVSFACLIKGLKANYVDENHEWVKQKAEKAQAAALEAYHPDPVEVTEQFNFHVRKALENTNNSTRRQLGHVYTGPCSATNPIDRCWRCRANWAKDRKKLANCVKGFGHMTTGGQNGRFYVVTDPSDDDVVEPKFGTLRHAAIQKEPLWIVFAHSMVITLKEELIVESDKTIDGRGVNVHIAHGAQITLQFVNNVIIHGLHIHDIVPKNGGIIRSSVEHKGVRGPSDGDGISIYGSTNIWIDHVTLKNCYDGLIDAVEGSTAITISNTHFSNHNESLLFGAHDANSKDAIMQITLAFNHFGKGLYQRMPRCRWGFFHVVNNDYTHWQKYAIGGSAHPTIISQGNRYIAPPQHEFKQVTHRDYAAEDEWMKWNWRSEGDLLLNGAFFRESGVPLKTKKMFGKQDFIKTKPATFVRRLTRFAGALKCQPGKKC